MPGDRIRLAGGCRSLKKLMIDRKIPARQRARIPVIADAAGVIAAYALGIDPSREAKPGQTAISITITTERGEGTV